MKRLPIGIDDFKTIIEGDYYYADNSSIIKEIEDEGALVTLITRPRRFGKTLTLSMFRYFYDINEQNIGLFSELQISKHEIYKAKNKYPVIFFSMKELKDNSWDNTYEKIKMIMQRLYIDNEKIEEVLNDEDKDYFRKIKTKAANQSETEMSLMNLTQYLERYHGQKAIVLIDEYDTPIISGYGNGYFKEAIGFMRNYLTAVLKTNTSLKLSILTGITRVSKENIFSGLNNLRVATVINGLYGNRLGFSEYQVLEMLNYYEIKEKMELARSWYNGYVFGKHRVYNPWSILNFISNSGLPQPYWVNTSSEDLIKILLRKNMEYAHEALEKLIKGETIEADIDESIDYDVLETERENIWSLFVQSGYLNIVGEKSIEIKTRYREKVIKKHIIAIPNEEIFQLFEKIIVAWIKDASGSTMIDKMLKELTVGDIDTFRRMFKDIVEKYFSYYNVGKGKGEEFYHAFSLGLFINLMGKYNVKSEAESGYGRSDLMLIPYDKKGRGIVIELKKLDDEKETELEETAKDALAQIEKRQYAKELEKEGIKEVVKLGIGFSGKHVRMAWS